MFENIAAGVKSALGRIGATINPTEYGYAEDLAGYVESEFDRRRNECKPWGITWRLIMAFIDGNQYLDINAATYVLTEPPKLFWWQEREVFNQIAPISETRIARISRMRPTLKTRAATGEPVDQNAAKISSKLLEFVEQDRFGQEDQAAYTAWLDSLGTCFIKNTWNPRAGRKIGAMQIHVQAPGQIPEPSTKGMDLGQGLKSAGKDASEKLNPTPQVHGADLATSGAGKVLAQTTQPIYEGDLDPVVVPPYEIFPDDPWHANIADCRSIIHAKAYSIEEIYEAWGVQVKSEPVDSFGIGRTVLGLGGLGYGVTAFYTATSLKKGYAVVKEMWERPSLKYPGGRLIVVCNKKVLHVGPLPYLCGPDHTPDIPIIKTQSIRRPGCFWGRSIYERLIPLQRRYNAVRNRKAEFLNRAAIGQWNVEDGSLDIEDFEDNAGSPGRINVVNKGFTAPAPVGNTQLPAAFETEPGLILEEFTIISGISDTAKRSAAPPGVKSGIALQIAIEQDDTRLSHTVDNINTSRIQAGKQWLRIYRQFATGPRILRTVGADQAVDVQAWTANDIRSDDVFIDTSPMAGETPALRRQMVFDLLQEGLFNNPDTGKLDKEGRAKLFELLQFGDWETADETEKLHIARAEKENRLIQQMGTIPPIKAVDDHITHIERHIRMILTDDFDQADQKAGGRLEQVAMQHIQMHQQAMLIMQQKMMQQQAAMEQSQIQMAAVKDLQNDLAKQTADMQMQAGQQLAAARMGGPPQPGGPPPGGMPPASQAQPPPGGTPGQFGIHP